MKKIFLSLMAAMLLVSAFGFQVNRAHADGYITYEDAQYVVGTGILFTFDATGFRNKDLKNATIYVGSDFYDLYCWVRKEEGKILCVARAALTEFAGQTGIIYLGGQIFYVTIPHIHGNQGGGTLTCGPGEVLGAEYMVDFGSGYDGPYFVPGDTLADADSQAASWFGQFSYYRVSGLTCGEIPT